MQLSALVKDSKRSCDPKSILGAESAAIDAVECRECADRIAGVVDMLPKQLAAFMIILSEIICCFTAIVNHEAVEVRSGRNGVSRWKCQ